MRTIKNGLKSIYTYLFNFGKICRFKSFGKGSFIGRRCTVHFAGEGITIGNRVRIGNDAWLSLYATSENEASISIGDGCYIGTHFSILTAAPITNGKNCSIASFVTILGENHGINPEIGNYGGQPLLAKPVVIGDGVWLGEKVSVMPGVTIGEKAIVGTCAVVTKDIPAYCMAVGNPAKVIKRYNFANHEWEKL